MTGQWGNSILVAGLTIGAMFVASPVVAQDTVGGSCLTCHAALGDSVLTPPAEEFPTDVHATKGLGCVACHGGDPTVEGMEAMDPAKGFIGRPTRQQQLEVCGHCHSNATFMRRFNPTLRVDQVQEYRTSVHGRRLVQFGDTLVAVCSSCHPAHRILPPSDPQSSVYALNVAATCGHCHSDSAYMRPYDIPTDQRAKYEQSIHWQTMSQKGDLSAPTCNDCHGNHGAAPPGVGDVVNVCGQCHTVMEDFFSKSKHASAFTMMGVPGCVTCHHNHDVEAASPTMLGLGEGAVCAQCHTASDSGGMAAVKMRTLMDSLQTEFDSATTLLDRAENAGVEVSQALFELKGAHDAQVAAANAVHTFDVTRVEEQVDSGLAVTTAGLGAGRRALREASFRRTGLAISVLIIIALLVGLVLKIRQADASRAASRDSQAHGH